MRCPGCGLKYSRFRTGFTYQDIFQMFWTQSQDPADWQYKGRHTVLGKWRQIKLEMWDRHIEGCYQHEHEPDTEPLPDHIPF